MLTKQGGFYFFRLRGKYFPLCFFTIFCIFNFTVVCEAQWKKIAKFPFSIGLIYFQESEGHPEVGFAGSWFVGKYYTPQNAGLWKTTDKGITWRDVTDPRWAGGVIDITFKDAFTGWVLLSYSNAPDEGCYKTIDGGDTWTYSPQTLANNASSVFFNKTTDLLFINNHNAPSFFSIDEGMTWKIHPFIFTGNGFSFWDDMHGLMTTLPGGSFYPFLTTTDGGVTWYRSSFIDEAYQPLAIPGTTSAFAVCEKIHNWLYRSDDYGNTWYFVHQFNPLDSLSGCIRGNFHKLCTQSSAGFFVSNDSGVAWTSLCGPITNWDTRFYVLGDSIYAGDLDGNLYLNVSGKANGPRLQIEKNNLTRHTATTTGSIIPVDIYYSKENYYEKVDSLKFTLSFNDGMIFNHDSVATGWKEIRRIVTDTNVTFILQRTDPNPPQIDTFVLRAYCQAIIAKEQTGVVALDEINFNQDTTFRDCMMASLTNTDSLFVDITDNYCGDSILWQFMTTGQLPSIISINPNPANGIIHIEIKTTETGRTRLELINLLGMKVAAITDGELKPGSHTFDFNSQGLPAGSYFVTMTTPAVRRIERVDVEK